MIPPALELPAELEPFRDDIAPLQRPALWLEPTTGPRVCAVVGGAPRLAPAADWPSAGGVPMAFVAELDFAAITDAAGETKLGVPARGVLALFLDLHAARSQRKLLRGPLSSGAFAVRWSADAASTAARQAPSGAITLSPSRYDGRIAYEIPDSRDLSVAHLDWERTLTDAYGDEVSFLEKWQDQDAVPGRNDKIGGWAHWCQSDLRRGYGGDPRDWMLVLQLHYRPELDIPLGQLDDSPLSLWVRREDLLAGRFEEAHLGWSLP